MIEYHQRGVEMEMHSICRKLKNLRESRNMKQNEVAEYLGISQQNYSRYENRKRDLPIRYLDPLSKLYHVSTDYILGLSVNKNDLHTMMQSANHMKPTSDLMEEMATLNPENMMLLSAYIEFLKFRQSKK